MNAAIWGFVGVIVGGVITAVSAYSAEWRQRRRQRRAAVNTVWVEMDEAQDAIFLSEEKWPIGWNLVTWNATWAVILEPLAQSLRSGTFLMVRRAYGEMFRLQQGLLTAGGNEVSDTDRTFFGQTLEALENARLWLTLNEETWTLRPLRRAKAVRRYEAQDQKRVREYVQKFQERTGKRAV